MEKVQLNNVPDITVCSYRTQTFLTDGERVSSGHRPKTSIILKIRTIVCFRNVYFLNSPRIMQIKPKIDNYLACCGEDSCSCLVCVASFFFLGFSNLATLLLVGWLRGVSRMPSVPPCFVQNGCNFTLYIRWGMGWSAWKFASSGTIFPCQCSARCFVIAAFCRLSCTFAAIVSIWSKSVNFNKRKKKLVTLLFVLSYWSSAFFLTENLSRVLTWGLTFFVRKSR